MNNNKNIEIIKSIGRKRQLSSLLHPNLESTNYRSSSWCVLSEYYLTISLLNKGQTLSAHVRLLYVGGVSQTKCCKITTRNRNISSHFSRQKGGCCATRRRLVLIPKRPNKNVQTRSHRQFFQTMENQDKSTKPHWNRRRTPDKFWLPFGLAMVLNATEVAWYVALGHKNFNIRYM